MNPADLQRIEHRLSTTLPEGYREFLLAYPAAAPEEVRRYDLFDDPATLVEETLIFRRYLGEDAAPERLVVIGDSGCGDRVCLDLATEEVLFWSHAEEEFVPIADSVEEYYSAVAEPV